MFGSKGNQEKATHGSSVFLYVFLFGGGGGFVNATPRGEQWDFPFWKEKPTDPSANVHPLDTPSTAHFHTHTHIHSGRGSGGGNFNGKFP